MTTEFLEHLDSIRVEEASATRIFKGDGRGVRAGSQHGTPEYNRKLAEAASLVADVIRGRKRSHLLQEAMTTSDFPLLFGDIIDRQLLANYREVPAVYRAYTKVSSVSDFRTAKRFAINGAESVLAAVRQQEEYPESRLSEASYSLSVQKYGRRIPFSWESMVNDDLDGLKDIPARFGRAARRSEQKYVTGLYVYASGPHNSFYTSGNANIVTSNPALSIAGLQTAMAKLAAQVDADGEPIVIDTVHLVVPPALEIVALNILNATELRIDNATAAAGSQSLATVNWMKNRVQLHVDPYIPVVASTANGSTSWFLFADPGQSRPALELAFLRGWEDPQVFIKDSNQTRVGGASSAMDGDFDTDSVEYKVRHVFGGARIDPKATVASNGSGS